MFEDAPMRNAILIAVASLGLSGCAEYGEFGSSTGYQNGYGYGSPYGQRPEYADQNCVAYDRYGRAYYTCGYGDYDSSNRYNYSPDTVVYYYPGYSYRDGYYYDGENRRYDRDSLYREYHHENHGENEDH